MNMYIMKISQKNIEKITDYCTGKITNLGDEDFTNLVLAYLDDSNSSTIREAVTANVCKYKWISEKLGWDAVDEATNEFKEIKPKRHSKDKKFNGGGNFSDLTPERIKKYQDSLQDSQYGMISSFFINGRLCYVAEFKLSDILPHLAEKVHKKCVKEGNRYARSVEYNYKHYIHSPNLKIHYIDFDLINEKKCFNEEFLEILEQKTNDRKLLEQKV